MTTPPTDGQSGVAVDAAKTQNRYVVFDLPFPLRLTDSLSIDDQQGPPFYVGTSPPCEIGTLLVMSKTGIQGMQARGELAGGDPYGRWSHSRIQVRFHCISYPVVQSWSDPAIVEQAVTATNLLVSNYRDLGNQPLVRELSFVDIVHFKIVEEFGEDDFREHWYSTGRRELVMGIDKDRKRMEEILRQRLAANVSVEFLRQLQLEVEAHVASGDHRLAVIEMAALFEAWLRRYICYVMAKRGVAQSEIDKQFIRQNGSAMGITEIAKILVPKLLGLDFLNSSSGKEWQNDLRDVRNALIHGSRENVSREEVQRAITAGRIARETIMGANKNA